MGLAGVVRSLAIGTDVSTAAPDPLAAEVLAALERTLAYGSARVEFSLTCHRHGFGYSRAHMHVSRTSSSSRRRSRLLQRRFDAARACRLVRPDAVAV